jgi:general secretion pathway protein A
MYQEFFGLRELPFELTSNPRFLYLAPKHREALSVLKHGVLSRKGLTVITGEAGLGKTTLLRAVFQDDAKLGVRAVCITNPALTRPEFLEFLAWEFSLGPAAAGSKTVLLRELERVLLEHQANGSLPTALVVDEAQSLPHELLEEMRLLGNIETPAEKLLPIVLVGQPELAARLNDPSLRQLKQRVALRCHLAPFALAETTTYIETRLRVAGSGGVVLFTPEAVKLIHQRSRGVPRTINVICDNALVTAYACGVRPVDAGLIREVCRDFDLERQIVIGADDPAAVATVEPVASGVAHNADVAIPTAVAPVATSPVRAASSLLSVTTTPAPPSPPTPGPTLLEFFARRRWLGWFS